ncbi:MAG: hypothetical protein KBD52_00485 [Candidatus Pacebacteria bacterium]|nr:hypothetical protein [Candidatus Paceibacterota bacterium]
MKDFFNNLSSLEKILLVITILGLVIAFFAWVSPFGIDRKSLSYSINQSIELIARDNISKENSLELRYNGEKIYNLVSTKIRIKNTGNQPILGSDFIEGLSVIFPSNVKIVNYNASQVQFIKTEYPQSLIKESDNQLKFVPVLINPEEIFELNVIITIEENDAKLKSLEEYLEKEDNGLFDFLNDNSQIGQDIEYNKEEIEITYKIYGVSKLIKVSEIMSNTERKKSSGNTILITFVFFLAFTITILLQLLEKPKEKDTSEEIKGIEKINNEKKKIRQKMTKVILILFIITILINLKNIYIYLFLSI